LRYIGFDGTGCQVRDALHPVDLADLVTRQLVRGADASGVWNVGGGADNALSLAQLSAWCRDRFGDRPVARDTAPRRWDVPWVVMNAGLASSTFGWRPRISLFDTLTQIAEHHRRHPDWLDLADPR
jgi:CDP-paratose 2-epimerase